MKKLGRAAIVRCLLLAMVAVVTGCSGPKSAQEVNVSATDLQSVAAKRIIFAHQSVGNNIVDGVRALARESGVQLNIVETRNPASPVPGLYHFMVGHNGAPEGKIEDFQSLIETGGTSGVDIAILKLCYIDFTPSTDGIALARRYLEAFHALATAHPETRFVAVTAPLTVVQTGPKAWVKRLLGRVPSGYAENARRTEFNEVLRAQAGSISLFDLARVETGSRADGQPESLDPALSSDGGHLNDRGQRVVAAEFLKHIAHGDAAS